MVRFRMLRINTTQFAILAKEAVEQYNIQASAELRHATDGSAVAVIMSFSFFNNGNKEMILQVMCEFGIHPDDVKTMTLEGKVIIPKDIIDYFIVQTVGTARGILHCKTEGTPFNGIIIPPMDVTNIISSDLTIDLPKE